MIQCLAFSPNLEMLIAFMFLAGLAGSTPVCLGAAIIADLFAGLEVNSQAMASFVVANNIGPSIGSPIGGKLLPWFLKFYIRR